MAKKIIPPKNGLTDSFLQHIRPQSQRFEIADKRTPGLRIRINPTGRIVFIWYYKFKGKNKVLTLGSYGAREGQMSLSNARKALAEAKLAALKTVGAVFSDSPKHGERFPYGVNYVERTKEHVQSHFGKPMTRALFGRDSRPTSAPDWRPRDAAGLP